MATGAEEFIRIGFLGSGFIANFHVEALQAVRGVRLAAVFSPTEAHRRSFADRVDKLGLGPCLIMHSVEDLIASEEVDAIWILGPNHTRLAHMRAIHRLVKSGLAQLRGVACEKPLGRTLAEASEMLRLAEDAGLLHGYLENQVFAPAVRRGKDILWRRAAASTGRPYLARAAEEHSGPHRAWFWRGDQQGGGALLDMMCHSVEVAHHLLIEPGRERASLRLTSATGTTSSLKWSLPEYAQRLAAMMGPEIDYTRAPAEDVAHGTLTLADQEGQQLLIQASTSWAYVGPGLRIRIEVLGPEYALEINTLATNLQVFLSRAVVGGSGEDLVEKQNAEQGLMPILEDEAATYGYVVEDRHMVEAFRAGRLPAETFHDGVAVTEMLMALYRSAELGRTIALPDPELASYLPRVARDDVHQ